ncbi:hypothetical protein TELCIR_12723 [Teladorsagia circumcincta]|uniref:Uncharacterized protein n=1 Tax=Teladorsagia circumcincta TaxID=45464 RepID=A0A2G9U5U2_TELCI|nr:hypothetical protein TELCIR_12723 [Teladorsagia circumcincta]
MAENERRYENAKRKAEVELDRCRNHIRKEFEHRRKRAEEAYKTEIDAMRHKLDRRLKDLQQAQTDMADQSIRSREEREKKMREVNESSKQVFNNERKRFSVGAEQLIEQKEHEHRELMRKLAIQEAKALERLDEIVATIHSDSPPVRSTSR